MNWRSQPRLMMVAMTWLALSSSGCALLIAGVAGGGAAGTAVSVHDSRTEHHQPMTYAGTVLANVLYCPSKVVFAAGGAATSGVTYLATLGRSDASTRIWNASVGGDYVMTPRMVEGKQPVHFVGANDVSSPKARS